MTRVFPLRTILIGLVIIALVVGLFAFGNSQCSATRKAEGEAKVSGVQSDLGVSALERSDKLAVDNAAGEARSRANSDFVNEATNAKQDAGDAGLRGRFVYCERQRMRNKPEPNYCPELRRAYRP